MRSYGALNYDLLRPTGYEIATEFRKRGKKVVLGGVHPTYCPDEAQQYGDAIVCGEAEALWPGLIADYETGAMKRTYKMESLLDGEALKSVMPCAKVCYRTFTAAFEASLEEVSINGLDMLSKDLQDA